MDGWNGFARAEPDMAAKARALLYQRGDGAGFLTTVAGNGTPRIHPLNVGIRDGRLLVFVQGHSAKARDLESNPHYALHAHLDADQPHEFMVRGEARLVTDPAVRSAAAADWFFSVADSYPLYELLIEHALLGEREHATDWPPRYRSWRTAGGPGEEEQGGHRGPNDPAHRRGRWRGQCHGEVVCRAGRQARARRC